MKQITDLIMQIITLIMGLTFLLLAILDTENVLEYLGLSIALVSVSILFSRIQDKEE